MAKSLKDKAVSGMLWTSVERFSTQIIQFVIGIAVARILSPSDYGIIGMTAIFFAIASTLIDSGFGSSLIQNRHRTETDYSTCFYFNIVVGGLFYLLFFFASPWIADFYNTPLLDSVVKVVASTLFINSLTIVQGTKLTVEMKFKTLSLISVSTQLFTGITGLILAICGWGVWALVFQMVGGSLLRLILLEFYTRWVPLWTFSRASFNRMFSFGSKILCSSMINTVYQNIYTLVIGRVFSPAEVGHFNRGNHFAALPSQTLLSVVMKVAYPLLAEVQDDTEKLRKAYLKFLRLPIFILYPALVGMIVLAHPVVQVLLGDKWLPCVPLMQILCFGYMFEPLTHINLNILYVKGRTDIVLKLELIKKPIAFLILFGMIPFGLWWMCAGKAFYSLIAFTFNCYYTGKYINYGFWKQMFYALPVFAKSAAMGAAVWGSMQLCSTPKLQLFVGIIVGIISYLLLVKMTKDESLNDFMEIIKSKVGRK